MTLCVATLYGAFDLRSQVSPLDSTERDVPSVTAPCQGLIASAERPHLVDVVTVEDLLLRVGLLADDVPELHHARLNPVLVSPTGTWVLQAELRVAPLPSLPVDQVRSLG